jgi:hypothetical protein
MHRLVSLITGSLFGTGLYLSQMTDTFKVQGWLNIFGDWDPTLTFVMGGAIIPMFFAWKVVKHQNKTVLGKNIELSSRKNIESSLIIGSILFGLGWGLAGLCPGPAIASLSFGGVNGFIFLLSMLVGIWLVSKLESHKYLEI